FTVPADVTALRFTLTNVNLQPNGPGSPPDAFEAALFDPTTGAALVGTAVGLTQTDAFFNLQTSGQTYFGAQAQVIGVTASRPTTARRTVPRPRWPSPSGRPTLPP